MRTARIIASFALLLLVSACAGVPSTRRVQRLFQKEHPDYSVVGITNEITSVDAYFHIVYTKPKDETVHEDVWHYWHAAETWVGVKKRTVK
jgi:hypothetical protein